MSFDHIDATARMRPAALLTAALLLAGCQSARVSLNTGSAGVSSVPAGTTVTTARVQASTDTRLGAAIIVGILLADGLRYFRLDPDGTRTPVPAPRDARSARGAPPGVSVQDCTRPVDLRSGNLQCR